MKAHTKTAQYQENIKLLVLDVDGVMTDGGMYYTESGDEFKRFNTKDGMAIRHLTKSGFQVAFLSSGKNQNIIRNRAELLGVQHVYVGFEEKIGILEAWRTKLGIEWSDIAYIGDDVNDAVVMGKVGLAACPSDAVDHIKSIATVHLKNKGGDACVREFIEQYIREIR
jgi:YrbI family 3-deoxy-D-manno-octulosonate 8-phosphate phosphatase